jgi:hypothetical protein
MNISIGIKVDGFKDRKITDEDLFTCKASKILIYLDKESNDRLMDYYKVVRAILRQGDNKVLLLINDDDNSNIAQGIVHLCLDYGCYNIYKVVNDTVIDKEYVLDMFKREANSDEVQQYVSNQDEAYETITEAMLHITEYCLDNKLDDLQDYIIENKDLIRKYPLVLDYMKQNIDDLSLGISKKVSSLEKDLQRVNDDKKEVEESKKKLDKQILDLKTEINQREMEKNKFKDELDTYKETLDKLQEEKESLQEKAKHLESSTKVVTGGGIFTNYTASKLTSIKGNRLKIVIYIKEITRPKYINTMVMELLEYLNNRHSTTKSKTKLVIYDNREDFSILYNPLQQANTNNYFDNRNQILSNETIVFTDVNPAYIPDLASQSKAEYLIVYDRLGKAEDLLTGNAIVKFYTFASKKDLINYKSKYSSLDESCVIMNPSNVNQTLELSEIPDFSSSLPVSARFVKYYKLKANANSAIGLFDAILTKCGLPVK